MEGLLWSKEVMGSLLGLKEVMGGLLWLKEVMGGLLWLKELSVGFVECGLGRERALGGEGVGREKVARERKVVRMEKGDWAGGKEGQEDKSHKTASSLQEDGSVSIFPGP
ncbi:hypothetical protein AMTR_s00015p00218980 [Amborella trichopoda]|uniref:Uncharacterized protein n=1 Tax=Amborella trichopoda TaxID=13333 RepID=W1PLH9_AMBTC|nr:hypothetical protein AMTR_s00015p00218980 [Amborella trichopoda]